MDVSNNALGELVKILHRGVLLPLQEMALRRVAASFWIDVLLLVKIDRRIGMKNYEDKVKDKAAKVLPELLKERMMYIVKPLGSSILNWLKCHEHNFEEVRKDVNLTILKHLHWTCKGSIDYKKTAKAIIELEMFSVQMRYKLACLYCLEDNIPILWEKLPIESKKFCRKGLGLQLERYWAYLVSGEENNLNITLKRQLPGPLSCYQFTFKQSAADGNRAATEYFFQKLTNEEQDFVLLNTLKTVLCERDCIYWGRHHFSKDNLSVVVSYLLSEMTPEMQTKIFNYRPCEVLTCFLDWSLKDFFVEVAKVILPFFSEYDYGRVLTMMHKSFLTLGYCPKLFQEFFQCSPCNFRKKFVDLECEFGYFLPEFFTRQDSETVKVIFKNIDAPDSVKLVFNERVFKLLCDFISTDKWRMVEVCLQEAILSNEDRQRLKNNFLKFFSTTDGGVLVKEAARKRKRFCELIGETYMKSPGEESSDDETPSKVKKLCSGKTAVVLPE